MYGEWEPFVTETDQVFAAGVADPGQDSTDVLLGIGVRYFGAQGLSGTIEFTSLVGRDHVEQHSLSAVLRAEF